MAARIPVQTETNEALIAAEADAIGLHAPNFEGGADLEDKLTAALEVADKPKRTRKAKPETVPEVKPPAKARTVENFPLEQITADKALQARVLINQDAIGDYKDVLFEGGKLPPLELTQDGDTYLLTDGFHRLSAYKKIGMLEVPVNIRKGTRRDAILAAVGANQSHGLRRSNADKRKATEMIFALMTEGGDNWTDAYIAELTGVSAMFVGNVRREQHPETITATRTDGKTGKEVKVTVTPPATPGKGKGLKTVEPADDDNLETVEPEPQTDSKKGPIGVNLDRLKMSAIRLEESVTGMLSIFPSPDDLGEALRANGHTANTLALIRYKLTAQLERLNAVPLVEADSTAAEGNIPEGAIPSEG